MANEDPLELDGIYTPKFQISQRARIATAGSCFAQHIARHMRKNGYTILDVEPAPPGLPESMHQQYGFSTYSGRYGNIYTVRQLLQLAKEAAGEWQPTDWIWEKDGRYYDALRPAVEPIGLATTEEVVFQRRAHVEQVRQLFESMTLFIFTLGLTETWVHRESGTVYPTAPGTIAGSFDPEVHEFQNATTAEIVRDFKEFQEVVRRIRSNRGFHIMLTVSPVPLTATATGQHVLMANTYSKSVLRAAAGHLSSRYRHIDYYPSYEIVTNPRLRSYGYSENLRTVTDETVENVMRRFFAVHAPVGPAPEVSATESEGLKAEVQCEDALLEAFGE